MSDPSGWSCPVPIGLRTEVVLGHGGGGRLTAELLDDIVRPTYGADVLAEGADAATLSIELAPGERLAMSTDAHVVQPLVFPGGDIGRLAVFGTVNDLACAGARPAHLTMALVIEEGMDMGTLARIAASIATAVNEVGVTVVAGDTKVVERGRGDGLHITTTGLGVVPAGVAPAPDRARPGDAVLISGPIGQHGVAVMSVREGIEFGTAVISDCAPVHGLVAALVGAGIDPHVLRDPTRGGVAAALDEIAEASRIGIRLDEAALPIPDGVRSACALLGLDPLHSANEGRLLVIVEGGRADEALDVLHRTAGGEAACRIGEVVDEHPGMVVGCTAIGGTRIIDRPLGELLPRIC